MRMDEYVNRDVDLEAERKRIVEETGARYLPRDWSKRPVGLYDDSTSVTVLTSLPAADAPPSYPRP